METGCLFIHFTYVLYWAQARTSKQRLGLAKKIYENTVNGRFNVDKINRMTGSDFQELISY